MSALRVPAGRLWAAAAANAARCPLPDHHRQVYAVLSRANSSSRLEIQHSVGFARRPVLTEGERWFLDSLLRLPKLSERQQARLNDIAVKVERGRA